MEKLLSQVGIQERVNIVAEYKPVQLGWWDESTLTEIEVEYWRSEAGEGEVTVIFSLADEGIVERVPVFQANFHGDALLGSTLVAESVYENVVLGEDWEFTEEMNAYFTDDFALAAGALEQVLGLIEHKTPLFVGDLDADEVEDAEPEAGDFLPHFISMLEMNAAEFKAEEISELLGMGIDYEGEAYLEGLKGDLATATEEEFVKQFGLDAEIFALIQKVVGEWEPEVGEGT